MSSVRMFEAPPPGSGLTTDTSTLFTPLFVIESICASSWLLLTKVVGRSLLLDKRTTDPGMKLAPVIDSVVGGPLGEIKLGVRLEMIGAGLLTENAIGFERL